MKEGVKSRDPLTVVFSDLTYTVELTKKFTAKTTTSSNGTANGGDAENGIAASTMPQTTNGIMKKELLQRVSGTFESGKCSAIMGPSGAGKSTLMDLLAQRKTTGETTGIRLYGGSAWTPDLKQEVAYVEQTDVLLGPVTVFEMLMYTAMFKLRERDFANRADFVAACKQRAEHVMEELSLTSVRDTHIGSVTERGISGGEAKRVNVGLSLLNEPTIIFADEPTSGLDSYTALLVVRALRNLAMEGKTVVASIHQPSQDIIALFDDLCLLAGGRIAYFGTFDGTHELFPLPERQTIAVSINGGTQSRHRTVQPTLGEVLLDACSQPNAGEKLAAKFEATDAAKEARKVRDEYIASCKASSVSRSLSVRRDSDDAPSTESPNGFYSTLVTLFNFRGMCALFRDEEYMGGQIYMNITFCLIFASMWPNLDLRTPSDLQDRLGLVFFSAILPYFAVPNLMAPLMDDKPLFAKERADGSYSLASYYCARLLIGCPTMMISWILGGTVLYWSTGLNNNFEAFIYFILVLLVNGTCAQAICQLMAFIMPTREFAQGFGFLPVVFGMLFAGFYVSYENIPPWWIWAYWGLPMRYAYEGLAVNEILQPRQDAAVRIALENRPDIIENLKDINKWGCLGVCASMAMAFLLAGYLGLYLKRNSLVKR